MIENTADCRHVTRGKGDYIIKKLLFITLLNLAFLTNMGAADQTGLLADKKWIKKIRTDHPRMIFTSDNIPQLQERARTICIKELNAIRKKVDDLPDQPVLILKENLFTRNKSGDLRPKSASVFSFDLVECSGSYEANQAALLYLITGEERYARTAHAYLKLALEVLKLSENFQIWADWQGNHRINMILAYDWIYNALTPQERRAIIVPILDYLSKSRGGGSFKFRRTKGSAKDGNYGENSLLLFAGLAAYGDGIDDVCAEEMLRYGVNLYIEMLDHREKLSAGSGLLSSATVTYSFNPYPYATFFFFHLWRSAFGVDVAERWFQMCDYPKWFDFAAFNIDERGRMLYHGVGDIGHVRNTLTVSEIYTHLAQTIHFYEPAYPEQTKASWAAMTRLPPRISKFSNVYPFLKFALMNFDPSKIKQRSIGYDSEKYFYNPGFGLLLMRSGTSADDTYASFRFGGSQSNHQHYDELSFTIYKQGFLALDAGTRCNTAHHHNYAAQTVAHNSILIHEKNEPIANFWKPWGFKPDGKTYYSHGGQNNFKGAQALALHSTADFIYAAGDATGSYAESKSREVTRQFIYIKPDIFVLYDRVESVLPEQKKEILFHAQNQPTEIGPQSWRFDNGGVLFLNTLMPEKPAINLEGGKGREFWASGGNWLPDGGEQWEQKYHTAGKWRLEISDSDHSQRRSEFLHILKASLPTNAVNLTTTHTVTRDHIAVSFADERKTQWNLTFNRAGAVGLKLKQSKPDGSVIFDQPLLNQIEN